MKPEFIQIQIERVDNGWVVRGFCYEHSRNGGYMPDGTHVAVTPEQLANLIQVWASKQATSQ